MVEFMHTNEKAADAPRCVRSVTLIEPADDTYALIQIPHYAYVLDVILHKTTAYGDAGATISVGFIGNGETADPDGFIDTTLGNADAADVIRASGDAQPGSQGKWFNDAGGMITVTCDDNGGTVGTFFIVAHFFVIH